MLNVALFNTTLFARVQKAWKETRELVVNPDAKYRKYDLNAREMKNVLLIGPACSRHVKTLVAVHLVLRWLIVARSIIERLALVRRNILETLNINAFQVC